MHVKNIEEEYLGQIIKSRIICFLVECLRNSPIICFLVECLRSSIYMSVICTFSILSMFATIVLLFFEAKRRSF